MRILPISPSHSVPISVLRSSKSSKQSVRKKRKEQRRVSMIGDFSHFGDAIRKDMKFLKKKLSGGIEWANKAFRIPQVSKTIDDLVWLRGLEDSRSLQVESRSWPQPSYPGLSGIDLFMADLEALEAYTSYFYFRSKIWSRPLPEVYDPEAVTDYFSCRPHVVVFRLLEVFSAFTFAAIRIRTSGAKKLLSSGSDTGTDESTSRYNFGIILKETLLDLGPTFIKVGQSLSTRPDIISTEISKALSELHDQIPPFPRSEAMKIIEEELGSPIESSFKYLSQETIAAASFGQVYRGITLDGFDVAVKVQRPNLHHVVVRDIFILRIALGLLQKITKRQSDLRLYADELGRGLVGELDYTLESINASQYLEAHSRFPFIRVPKIFQHLSRKRVLTMEWIVGENPTDLLSMATTNSVDIVSKRQKIDAEKRLLDLVNKGVEATLVQLLETGFMHADPHPGNLLYTSSGQIGFLDFGLVCRMERKHQFAMLASILHIVSGDWASLVEALNEMDVIRPGTNMLRFTMDLEDALGEVEFRDGIPDVKFSKVLGNILSVAVKYHCRMPPYFTLVLRSLASFEGLALAGDKSFKTFEAAYPYVIQKLLTDNSAAARKILHSVVLNRRKEFRWEKVALFLKVGGTRKGLQQVMASNGLSASHLHHTENGTIDAANLVLKLLASKNGLVLRRLLMTADGASLVQAMVSKEAHFLRQEFCRIIANVLYQKMFEFLGKGIKATHYLGPSTSYDYESLIKDRRLKLIFSKVLNSAKRDPILMTKFGWASFVISITATAIAFHRLLISLSETYLSWLSLSAKRVAISV